MFRGNMGNAPPSRCFESKYRSDSRYDNLTYEKKKNLKISTFLALLPYHSLAACSSSILADAFLCIVPSEVIVVG